METIKHHIASFEANMGTSHETGVGTWFNRWAEKFETARFFWMTMIITFQSCLGSIAGGYFLHNNSDIALLAICAMVTMACNAILIAQAPAKWCLVSSILSVTVNTALIIVSFVIS